MTKNVEFSELKTILGDRRVSTGESFRTLHSHDESFHTPALPEVVVWPNTTEEVSRLVRWASQNKMPLTAWGAGTSLEGNPIPVQGGMVIDFNEMMYLKIFSGIKFRSLYFYKLLLKLLFVFIMKLNLVIDDLYFFLINLTQVL